MYRISKNKRRFSPTPIVHVTVGADGKEHEEIVLIACGMKKKEGDRLSELVVRLLNEVGRVHQQMKERQLNIKINDSKLPN